MPELKGFKERVAKMVGTLGSQRALARVLGVSNPSIMTWMGGANYPHESTLLRISQSTGVSIDWLMRGEGDDDYELEKIRSLINNPRILLQATRMKAGFTAGRFAQQIGYQLGVLQAVEEGRGQISEKMAEAICRVLPELTKEELMGGSDTPRIMDESGATGTYGAKPSVTYPGHAVRYVPLLSWAQAGGLDNGALDGAYAYEGVISVDVKDPKAFAVAIRGNSMEPRIIEGDSAIVCPSWKPRTGDTVIARTVDGDVMCKIFQPKNGGKMVVLSSYNPAHPPIELKWEEIAWIYPIAQTVQNHRRE